MVMKGFYMEIKELVGLARNKDNVAIAEIIQLTEKKAFYIALNVVKNDETARDIVQESYIKAFQKLDSLDDDAKFVSWFNQIVSRQALDYHKSSYNQHRPTEFSAMDDEENRLEFEANIANDRKEFEPDASFDYGELKEGVQGVLDDLPENQRAALVMYYFEDMKVSEISQVFNVSDNTVKGYLAYGRKKIKNTIEGMRLKGVSFYGVAPMPFLTWMLKDQFAKTAVTHVSKDIIIKTVTTSTVTAGVASTTSKHGIKKAFASASTKVKAGVCAGAVATTGAVGYAIHDYNSNYNQVVRAIEKLDTLQQFTTNVNHLWFESNEDGSTRDYLGNFEARCIMVNGDSSNDYYGVLIDHQNQMFEYEVDDGVISYTQVESYDINNLKLDSYENEIGADEVWSISDQQTSSDFEKDSYKKYAIDISEKQEKAVMDKVKNRFNTSEVTKENGNKTFKYKSFYIENSKFHNGDTTVKVTIDKDGYLKEICEFFGEQDTIGYRIEFTDFVK